MAGPSRTTAGHLPAPLTGLVGRHDDLARIDTLLAAGRPVTVAGPGGAGKTPLAVEAARHRRQAYRDRARMTDLAPVTEPAKMGAAQLTGTGPHTGTTPETRTRSDSDETEVLLDPLDGRKACCPSTTAST
ncbi:hypothetical protein ACFV23_15690 [Streptomyces sp. NPDC059627]